ncbi:proteasome subunit [Nitzschia inconspicua]|uniref:Proteasome subunit n=1 Tax=Nitzschia inconspicua TaxID=303405 RepID=A0A9K3PZT6_9STRA|nr:proteasome subunit [Nitzschia inconspicua]
MLLFLFLSTRCIDSSSPSRRIGTTPKFPLPGVIPDLFVAAAPLIVGVVCQDAVLLLAVHTSFADANDESILLFADGELVEAVDDDTSTSSSSQQQQEQQRPRRHYPFIDLPRSYRGPFRIYPLENAAVVCAGWRTDGECLAEYLQSLDRQEIQLFGDDTTSSVADHGSFLANQASLRMASQCLSAGRRPWSTVGLLASSSNKKGELWLVDATGAYRVRAHAVGNMAGPVNEYFLARNRDWTTHKCHDVAKELLSVMFDSYQRSNEEKFDVGRNNRTRFEIPSGSLVEMMAVGLKEETGNRGLARLFASTLFGRTATSSRR